MHCEITHRFSAVRLLLFAVIWLCGSSSLFAQTFTTSYLFGAGGSPRGTLVEGTDGNLYGTTYGKYGNGMIFKITPSGSYTTLHSGGTFQAGLTVGTDGNFYGTSIAGVFRITPSGTFTTLYNFGADYLLGTLVQASDGNFYGTTLEGGSKGSGMLFRITPSGTLTTFCSRHGCADGTAPLGLIQGTDGNLYGITGGGGSAGGLWDNLQNHYDRHADHAAQLRLNRRFWSRGSGSGQRWKLLRGDQLRRFQQQQL